MTSHQSHLKELISMKKINHNKPIFIDKIASKIIICNFAAIYSVCVCVCVCGGGGGGG